MVPLHGLRKTPAGWTSPTAGMAVRSLPQNRRFIRHGSIFRDIELVHEPEQLALRVTLASVDDALPEQRRRWLEKFIASANASWRLVRIGFAPDSRSIVAEIDPDGSPGMVLRPLFQTALDSLRWVVSGLAETTGLPCPERIAFASTGSSLRRVNPTRIRT